MRKVLADRHHAGLLYSLQLLFEDRLGMELYVPVGHDWWDEGYWRFGEVFGDDRLAQQYLMTEGRGWELGEGGWTTYDVEYPERPIKGITLTGFRLSADRFFGTVASVQENQAGYHRLAGEYGLKSIYQVGNRGQQVKWDLDPLAIISAEAKIPEGGRGLVYHQEFDKDGLFAFSLPDDRHRRRVRSYVNCFPSIPSQWAAYQALQQEMGDAWEFRAHGSDGPQGKVVPTTNLARTMAASGWGYHDKPQGDGFGHAIHYLAAIGRPLVGSANNYRGLMAEPLWEDGVTSVNVDGKSREQVAKELREIAYDADRHDAMCLTIRAKLDAAVDFDAEEQAIRALLGLG